MKFVRMLVLIACAMSLLAIAQDKPKPADKDKKAAKPPAAMGPMKPSPEMQKLAKALVGSYTVKETHDPSPFMPNGGTGTGESKFVLGPGGHSIVQTYVNKSGPMGGGFRGQGLVWYDAKAGGYRSVWCDSMSPGCEVSGISKWDGDKLTGTTTAS